MIRAILLDLGKVIVPFDFSIGYRAMQARCGLTVDELRDRIRSTGLVPRFETGLIEPEPFVHQLSAAVGLNITYPDFCQIWGSIFSRETLIPDDFLQALHRNYPLILVSNTNRIHFEMILRDYPILRHFDHFLLSYEVQSMKPAPLIFEKAVAAAKVAPHECFFTDDIPAYVEGAKAFGIDAVLFTGFEHLKYDLAQRGVAW